MRCWISDASLLESPCELSSLFERGINQRCPEPLGGGRIVRLTFSSVAYFSPVMWNETAAQHCWLKLYVIDQKAKIHIHAWWWPYCVRASKYLKSWELCAWSPREGKHNYVNKLFATSPERVCLVLRELLFPPELDQQICSCAAVMPFWICAEGAHRAPLLVEAIQHHRVFTNSLFLKKKESNLSLLSHNRSRTTVE